MVPPPVKRPRQSSWSSDDSFDEDMQVKAGPSQFLRPDTAVEKSQSTAATRSGSRPVATRPVNVVPQRQSSMASHRVGSEDKLRGDIVVLKHQLENMKRQQEKTQDDKNLEIFQLRAAHESALQEKEHEIRCTREEVQTLRNEMQGMQFRLKTPAVENGGQGTILMTKKVNLNAKGHFGVADGFRPTRHLNATRQSVLFRHPANVDETFQQLPSQSVLPREQATSTTSLQRELRPRMKSEGVQTEFPQSPECPLMDLLWAHVLYARSDADIDVRRVCVPTHGRTLRELHGCV